MRRILLWLSVILLTLSCTLDVSFVDEEAQVNSVLDTYDTASANEDEELFFSIFSDTGFITGFGLAENEIWNSYIDFEKDMKVMFEVAADIKTTSRNRVVEIHESGAIAFFREILDIDFTVQGNKFQRYGVRFSGVMKKSNSDWKIVQFHFSLPFTAG